MDELDNKLKVMLTDVVDGRFEYEDTIKNIYTAFHDAGYIKLPGNAQNVTITTSDNTHDGKLMTEQEWREKFNA